MNERCNLQQKPTTDESEPPTSEEEDEHPPKSSDDNMDLDENGGGEFRSPRKTKRHKRQISDAEKMEIVTFVTSNRFDPLQDTTATTSGSPQEQHRPQETAFHHPQQQQQQVPPRQTASDKPPKVPPITIQFTGHYLQMNAALEQHLDGPIKAIYRDDHIKYHFDTLKDYQAALAFFKSHNFHLYTHQLQSDRRLKVVIKGLPPTIKEEEIHEELVQMGFHDVTVYQFKKRDPITNQLLKEPIYCLSLPRVKESDAIYDVRGMLYTRVIIEDYENKDGPPQCKRCQAFSHTANYCLMPARCVRCGDHHQAKDCTRARTLPPTCCNCGQEGHPASWKGCPTFQKAIRDYHYQRQVLQRRQAQDGNQPQQQPPAEGPSNIPALPRTPTRQNQPHSTGATRPSYKDVFSLLAN